MSRHECILLSKQHKESWVDTNNLCTITSIQRLHVMLIYQKRRLSSSTYRAASQYHTDTLPSTGGTLYASWKLAFNLAVPLVLLAPSTMVLACKPCPF